MDVDVVELEGEEEVGVEEDMVAMVDTVDMATTMVDMVGMATIMVDTVGTATTMVDTVDMATIEKMVDGTGIGVGVVDEVEVVGAIVERDMNEAEVEEEVQEEEVMAVYGEGWVAVEG